MISDQLVNEANQSEADSVESRKEDLLLMMKKNRNPVAGFDIFIYLSSRLGDTPRR